MMVEGGRGRRLVAIGGRIDRGRRRCWIVYDVAERLAESDIDFVSEWSGQRSEM